MVSIVFSYLRSEPINLIERRFRRLTIAKGAWVSNDVEEVEQRCDPLKNNINLRINRMRKSSNTISTPQDTCSDDSNTSHDEAAEASQRHHRDTCHDEPRTPPCYESKYNSLRTPETVEFTEEDDDFSVSTLGSVVSDAGRDPSRSKVSNYSPIAVGSF